MAIRIKTSGANVYRETTALPASSADFSIAFHLKINTAAAHFASLAWLARYVGGSTAHIWGFAADGVTGVTNPNFLVAPAVAGTLKDSTGAAAALVAGTHYAVELRGYGTDQLAMHVLPLNSTDTDDILRAVGTQSPVMDGAAPPTYLALGDVGGGEDGDFTISGLRMFDGALDDAGFIVEAYSTAPVRSTGLIDQHTFVDGGSNLANALAGQMGGAFTAVGDVTYVDDQPTFDAVSTTVTIGGELEYAPDVTVAATNPSAGRIDVAGAFASIVGDETLTVTLRSGSTTVQTLTKTLAGQTYAGSFTGVANGAYTVRAIITDAQGSKTADTTLTLSADTTGPNVTLGASQTSIITPTTITLTAAAADPAGISSIQFYKDGVAMGAALTTTPATRQVAFSSNADNGNFSFTAVATDGLGNSTTSAAVVVGVAIPAPVLPPAAPSNLLLVAKTATTLTISFTDNSDPDTGFGIERQTGPTTWTQIGTAPATGATGSTVTVALTGLTANTQYTLRAQAINNTLGSGYSNTLTVTTDPLAATTALSLLSASTAQIAGAIGETAVVTMTARATNGSTVPGVAITARLLGANVATLATETLLSGPDGTVQFSLLFTTVGQTSLAFTATDGSTTLDEAANPAVGVFTNPSTLTAAQVQELLDEQSPSKYDDEIRVFALDFSDDLAVGESLALPVRRVQIIDLSTATDMAASMALGPPITVGTSVCQFLQGGLAGHPYLLRVQCDSSIGQRLEAELRVRIFPSIGRKGRTL